MNFIFIWKDSSVVKLGIIHFSVYFIIIFLHSFDLQLGGELLDLD